jgi:pyruvate/2-oxoglutarate dehydrogenase complex dihydrolipoamide dehydrogenase (E3) component
MFDIVVLGGGPAGVMAALRARELGASVALVERARFGGTSANDGCVPTRVLAKVARLAREAQQFPEYGLMGEPPVVDFGRVIERTQHIVYAMHEKKQIGDHLAQAGVTVYAEAGATHFIDEHTLALGDGRLLQADRAILSVGGHARRINFPGSELALTHSDIWSLRDVPRSIAIVGGAATGCQLATIFSAFGTRVYLLETSARIQAREDEAVSQALAESFKTRGIEIITNIGGVDQIEPLDAPAETMKRPDAGAALRLWFTQQGQTRPLEVDAVLLSVGWVGNIDDLNLAAVNVKTERGYVVVDDCFRTSNPNIFAAGDVTGRMMLVQSGQYEGRMAAENAVLGPGQPYKHLIVPHGGFTDPEYASVGLTEALARAAEPDCVVATVSYGDLDRAIIDDLTEGMCKLIVSQETHRILGAHVVGEQAVEAIQLIAAGMASGMWVEQLAELELAYPTYTSILGLAARRVAQQLGVMALAPEWRSLGVAGAPLAEWERAA